MFNLLACGGHVAPKAKPKSHLLPALFLRLNTRWQNSDGRCRIEDFRFQEGGSEELGVRLKDEEAREKI